jgi:hypothetical protein
MAVCHNVEGRGHGLLDFYAPTKESLTYKYRFLKVLKSGFRRKRRF